MTRCTRLTRPLLLAAALLLAACKGADGPTGPQGPAGPAGPQGIAGALNRFDGVGVFTSTQQTVAIPAASIVGGKLPTVACYISPDGTAWLQVAQSNATYTYCAITGIPGAPGVTFVNAIPGWRYDVVVGW